MCSPLSPPSCPGLSRLRGRSRFGAAKARASTLSPRSPHDVDGWNKPGHDGRRGRAVKRLLTIAVALVVALGVALTAYTISLGPLPLQEAKAVSTTVVDRHGKLLRAYAMADGRWRLPVSAKKDVDPTYLKLLLAYEDQRFYDHHGVDPRALARAAIQLGSHGHIVSGGSTITMQLARLLEPRRQRSLHAKLRQIVRALELEHQLSKDEILDLYLTLAPYGGNLEGIRAASIAYFGKEPRRLAIGQAALLVALPQLPERRRPDRFPQFAEAARQRVLDRLAVATVIGEGEADRAHLAAIPKKRLALPSLAAHLTEAALRKAPKEISHKTTLKRDIQQALEAVALEAATRLGPRLSVAIVMADAKTAADYEYNVDITRRVTDMAHWVGASVEGELGCLGSLETGHGEAEDGHGFEGKLSHDELLTDPDQAVEFVHATGVDALAIAMGTSHGAYKFSRKPDGAVLAMNVIEAIHKKLPDTHLVMHGSSSVPQELQDIINAFGGQMPQTWGVPVEEIQRGIKHGVRKINIDTDNRMAMTGAIRKVLTENPSEFDPRKYLAPAMAAMKKLCIERFEAFGTAGHADKIKPVSLTEMAKRYKSGSLAPKFG